MLTSSVAEQATEAGGYCARNAAGTSPSSYKNHLASVKPDKDIKVTG